MRKHLRVNTIGFDLRIGDHTCFARVDERNVHVLVKRFVDRAVVPSCFDGNRRPGILARELFEFGALGAMGEAEFID
ncbi:hypothetical protein C492_08225, partial [Natronococcus jeotgali DSM 18795]